MDVDGKHIHYEKLGKGKPVVFLHGWLTNWRVWLESMSMQELATSYTAITLDFWGFGLSEHCEERYSLKSYQRLLVSFLQAVSGGESIHLVGHGLGAIIGALVAIEHPLLIDKLILVSFPIARNDINVKLTKQKGLPSLLAEHRKYRTIAEQMSQNDVVAVRRTAFESRSLDTKKLFENLTRRQILVVHGRRDIVTGPFRGISRYPVPSTSSVHFVAQPFLDHFPMLEDGRQFNYQLKLFLALGDQLPPEPPVKDFWLRRPR